MLIHTTNALINLYDQYGAILYGIALQMVLTEKEASQILLTVFEKAKEHNILKNNKHCICAALIKLTVVTARQSMEGHIKSKNPLNLLPAKPLLHEILFENKSLSQLSNETKLSVEEIRKKVREELNSLREADNDAASVELQRAAR